MTPWIKRTPDRDAEIMARWLELRNFAAVGREFGLGRERIRQIVSRIERAKRRVRLAG